jgi:signal transduction histidine kinase
MPSQLTGGTLADAGPSAGLVRLRNALSGLTPQLLAIVALLLLVRVLSASGEDFLLAFKRHELDAWFAQRLDLSKYVLIMAVPILVVIFATANLGPQRGIKRIAALAAAVVLSTGAAALLRRWMDGKVSWDWDEIWPMLAYVWPRYVLLAGLLTAAVEFVRREVASTKAMQQAEVDRAAFEREMTEARLQVLQAQIEPHFLFNTLANVRRLYEKDLRGGAAMLDNLMRYLEIALPRMRDSESTLEREKGLAEAFLRVQQIRMGHRLAFSIDVPAHLRNCPVPPMMLLTLVENAIKHGLDPVPAGGVVRITARADGDRLLLSVADTGVGFAPGSGTGTGLANIRARLMGQFGDSARLTLENNDLGGATAIIALPLTIAVANR